MVIIGWAPAALLDEPWQVPFWFCQTQPASLVYLSGLVGGWVCDSSFGDQLRAGPMADSPLEARRKGTLVLALEVGSGPVTSLAPQSSWMTAGTLFNSSESQVLICKCCLVGCVMIKWNLLQFTLLWGWHLVSPLWVDISYFHWSSSLLLMYQRHERSRGL